MWSVDVSFLVSIDAPAAVDACAFATLHYWLDEGADAVEYELEELWRKIENSVVGEDGRFLYC